MIEPHQDKTWRGQYPDWRCCASPGKIPGSRSRRR